MSYQVDDEILGKAYDARLVRRLLGHVRPYKRLVLVATAALVLYSCVDVVQPLLIRRAMNGPIAAVVQGRMSRSAGFGRLAFLAGIFGGTVLLGWLLRTAQMWMVEYLGQRVMVDIRRELFAKIQDLPLRFFDKNPVGRLVTRVVSDVEALYQALSSGLVSIFGDLVEVMAIVAILLYLNAGLSLFLFCVIPLLFVASLRFRIKSRKAYRDVRKELARTNANIQESISGVRVLQIFGRERKAESKFFHLSGRLFEAQRRTVFHFATFFPTVEFLFAVAQGILIWVGAAYVAHGTFRAGDFVAFWLFINLIFEPIRDLSQQYNTMQAAMASSERIFKILDTEDAIANPARPLAARIERPAWEIEFDHVWFAYDEKDWVLRDVSFRIGAGESVALVGATGAGKTSIISLVSRLYDVNRGRILIDGRDVRDYDKYELRSQISVVLQDVFLFAGDVEENIRLGHAEIPGERIVAAAEAVNADRFIRELPGGYHAPVLERGATLSTGQKQLLAFARALALDPRILILDEATSSVDTETEVLIQKALQTLLAGRTSVIIAHRLSTIQQCDRILVLHRGELREQGSHQELLKRRGIYRRLYELQYGLDAAG